MDLDHIKNFVPFLLATGQKQPDLNWTRIAESLVIAGITGGIILWGAQREFGVSLSTLKTQVTEMREADKESRNAIERKIDEISKNMQALQIDQLKRDAAQDRDRDEVRHEIQGRRK